MIEEKELVNIKAGGVKWTVGLVVGAVISFFAGLIDGYLRPLGCNG